MSWSMISRWAATIGLAFLAAVAFGLAEAVTGWGVDGLVSCTIGVIVGARHFAHTATPACRMAARRVDTDAQWRELEGLPPRSRADA